MKQKVIGVDIGGTSTKIGIVNSKGNIIQKFVIKNDNQETYLNNVIDYIYEIASNNNINSIGFAAPGFINDKMGIIVKSGNLNLNNFNFRNYLNQKFNDQTFSTTILNDANAAGLGELWKNSNPDDDSLIFYTLGTGVGGAIILNGKLVTGKNGFAGEFGHGGFMQHSKDCTCGLKYCLEAISSPLNISKNFEKLINKTEFKKFNFSNQPTFKEIREKYFKYNKPPEIKEILLQSFKPLASHMSLMINSLDIEQIIIGGGASSMGDDLIEILKELLSEILLDIFIDKLTIKTSILGNDAGILGAAYSVMIKSK